MANRDVIVKLRLAGEQFDRDFKVKFQDLTAAAEQASAQAGTKAGSSFGAGFAAAAAAAGAGMGLAISSAATLGKEIASTSKQFNIGVENLQVWRQAAATAGVSADNLSEGLGSLTEKIGEANAGNKEARQGFADLGVSFKTVSGQARGTDEVMLDLAKRIAEIKDPTERVRLGQQLLGDEFKNLYPLLLQGADGFRQAATDLGEFGAMLSQEEIRNLEQTNAKIEQMKNVLAIRVAGIVADNAQSIIGLADAIATLTGSMISFIAKYPEFSGMVAGAAAGSRFGMPGALIGGVAGLAGGIAGGQAARDSITDPAFRKQQLEDARYAYNNPVGTRFPEQDAEKRRRAKAEFDRQNELYLKSLAPLGSLVPSSWSAGTAQAPAAAARVTAPRAGGPRNATQSAAEREAERAAKDAIRNEEQLRDAIARTLRAQDDSAKVASIRAEQGDEAAARAEAELGFLRQHPLAVNDTVDQLAKALGITKELTQADKDRLQLLIDQGNAAQKATGDAAAQKVRAEQDREAKRQAEEAERLAEQQAEVFRRLHEQAIMDVADFYEIAFRGGTKDLWRSFKDEGTRSIAEIAAQWTLAMLSGQGFNLNSALGGAMGRSPLASIFMGAGGGFGAANDNGGFGGLVSFGRPIDFNPVLSGRGAASGGLLPTGGILPTTGGGFDATLRTPFLKSPGFALGLGTLTTSLVGGGQASQLGGLVGSVGGQALGSSIAALGSFGGPVGAIAGALLGSILPKVIASPKRASVTVGGLNGTLGITGRQGNSAARDATATQGAGSLIDAIFQIAGQLGGGVDASRGSVSFGMRKNSFRVDTSGGGATKIGNGAVDFGSDQEAAIRFAITDLIKDGVITGISQASQNLLSKGGDLDKQIEKALLLEQIPKLLRQRTDPLGAAIDELAEKFKRVNEALIEGSASAEQFAQARQLWELEKADAIASIGAASQSLKDFLASLQAGSNSPLSLREQRAEAERQLQPFVAQITAAEAARAEVEGLRGSGASAADIAAAEERARTSAAAINQDGFTQASQLLLSISRQSNASSGAFFSDFDRVRALTGQAIGFVDQASARGADTRDPFARETAANTKDTALILGELSVESRAQGETLRQIAAALASGSGVGFINETRAFVR